MGEQVDRFRSARDRLRAMRQHVSEIEYWLMTFMLFEASK